MQRAVVVAVMLLAPGFASAAQERSTAVVPDLANTSLDRAVVRLHRLGLRVGTTTPYYLASNSVPLVGGESPPVGTTAPAGAVVTLKVFEHPTVSPRATDVPERVPSVTGRTLAAAVKRIE